MNAVFTILVADRNRNIREFLQRELTAQGHRVLSVCDARQILKIIEIESPDLLILDLDIPYVDEVRVLDKLQNGTLAIPLVVHTLLTDYATHPAIKKADGFVEKDGNNVNNLKQIVAGVLQKHYPQRFLQASQARTNKD